ncbi:unannotated protein [freshwater metagenome]|uniref:Unannotated protein n=1 Tax=freshwater metagenome TaxID=449393 RepID=A0A6J6YQ44_9ZZZZ
MPLNFRSVSNESTCLPKALRRTVILIPPKVSCPAIASSTLLESKIIPAHEPYVGIPLLIRCTIKSNKLKLLASLAIVVDSPPGITIASILKISLSVLTGTAITPQSLSDWMCSRTSPWSARTPIFIYYQPRSANLCGAGISATLIPTIASPNPRETSATTLASV